MKGRSGRITFLTIIMMMIIFGLSGAVFAEDKTSEEMQLSKAESSSTEESEYGISSQSVNYSYDLYWNTGEDGIEINGAKSLTYYVGAVSTTNSVSWQSSDTSVLQVKSSSTFQYNSNVGGWLAPAEITSISPGTADVSVTVSENGVYVTKSWTFTVNDVQPTSLQMDQSAITLKSSVDQQLSVTVLPVNAFVDSSAVKWMSADTNIAEVNQTGKVTYKNSGTTLITASLNGLSTQCSVTALKPVASISLDRTEISCNKSDTRQLTATRNPEDSNDTEPFNWTSDNESVATVDSTGKVTAVGGGTCTITAEKEGKTAICNVTVNVPLTGISILYNGTRNFYQNLYTKGDQIQCSISPTPADATYNVNDIKWSVNSTSYCQAEINSDGLLTINDFTDDTNHYNFLTVTAELNGIIYQDSSWLRIVSIPDSIKISESTLSLYRGDTANLTANREPTIPYDYRSVLWKSSDSSVATVDSKGLVTAVGGGTAEITAEIDGVSAVCTVSVTVPLTGLSLNEAIQTLTIGGSCDLIASKVPTNATIDINDLQWTSSDDSVVKVENGKVTALKSGKADITASLGGKTAICNIAVYSPAETIDLNQTSLNLEKNNTSQLTAAFSPNDTNNPETVQWDSKDPAVASVSSDGLVTAVSGGNTEITAQINGVSATCTVTVTVPLTGITLDATGFFGSIGVTHDFQVTKEPEDATAELKDVQWTSSDESVAKVENGKITILSSGKTDVTAALDGKTAVCNVVGFNAVQKITLNNTALTLDSGNAYQLTATCEPADSNNPGSVEWTSSNPDVVSVDSTGIIICNSPGTAVIIASQDSGKATCSITVFRPITNLSLDKTEVTSPVGNSFELSVSKEPVEETADLKDVHWLSSDETVATVEDGKVTVLASGEADILAILDGKKAVCHITAYAPVEKISLGQAQLSIVKGTASQLAATIEPDDSRNPGTVKWESSDPAVATVDDNGLITAVSAGDAIITASQDNGMATCTVTVTVPLTGITLDATGFFGSIGVTHDFQVTKEPEDATAELKDVQWTSSDESVAKVENGKITILSSGKTDVTAALDGKTAVCNVVGFNAVQKITLNNTALTLDSGNAYQLTATCEPADSNNPGSVEWTSSNPDVVSVDSTGIIICNSPGTAVIIASQDSGKATCSITVFRPITNLSLDKTEVTSPVGNSFELSVSKEPVEETADLKDVHWLSSDETVATVEDGKVTVLASGEADILAILDGKKAVCHITAYAPVEKISLGQAQLSIVKGTASQLAATIEPDDSRNPGTVKWESSDPEVASVDESGLISGLKAGTAEITAFIGEVRQSCQVTVTIPVQTLELSQTSILGEAVQTVQLSLTKNPTDATADVKDAKWTSSDPTIAAVNEGLVTLIRSGKATITAELDGKEISCDVTVYAYLNGLKLNESSASLIQGQTIQLNAFRIPEDVNDTRKISWSSSDLTIASVDKNGLVTANASGTATITASLGEKSTQCVVTVYPSEPNVTYSAYVQNSGWQPSVKNGEEAGTTGKSLQLQALKAEIEGINSDDLGLTYRTHMENYGWIDYSSNGAVSGKAGSDLRMEAVQIKLTGKLADQYDVYYSLHVENIGWMDWAKNGAPAGSEGLALRVESIKIKVVKKGSSAPGSEAVPFASKYGTGSVRYRTHVENIGWQSYVQDGAMSGTSHQSLRLEGINITLNPGVEGSIEYRTHIQDIGWESSYKKDNEMSGTSGRTLRLEAIQIRLTGKAAEEYDVYYRVHCQNIGWMGWAKNGEQSGSAGYAYRLEGIQIQLVPKGADAPVNDGDTTSVFEQK